jgi:enamine deaminase RidA (YjgF/YER057c/UK114 family)
MSDEQTTSTNPETPAASFSLTDISRSNAIIVVLCLVIVFLLAGSFGDDDETMVPASEAVAVAPVAMPASAYTAPAPVYSSPAPAPVAAPVYTPPPAPAYQSPVLADSGAGIERNGEGRFFYTTIKIPANAETLYLSGTGASRKADGTWGNMEEQAIDTFTKFKGILEAEGWSMSDIVQVRVFAVAGEYGLLDFDGFNRGYQRFFGTEENPMKPVRSFIQVAALVNPDWLIEIEIRAARVPGNS